MSVFEVGKNKIYKTISAAIEAANNGDEIIVEPNTYTECLEINKELYIHSSLDLTKARNNFSSDDIPIIYIKSFETLKITAKCRLENLLFTQKKDLTFGLLSEVLVKSETAGEIFGSKLIRELNDEEFEAMVEISSDMEGKNCFFCFSSYHGLFISNGIVSFEKTIFSNIYADSILMCNEAELILNDNCAVKNTINGYGIYAANKTQVKIQDSSFSVNECSSIVSVNTSTVSAKNCSFSTSEIGITMKDNSKLKIENCELNKNSLTGVFIGDESDAEIKNSVLSESKIGVFFNGNSSGRILKDTISNNLQGGIGVKENAQCFVSESNITNNSKVGVGLNNCAKARIEKCQFKGIDVEENICFYSDSEGDIQISDTSFDNGAIGILFRENSNAYVVNCQINNFSGIGLATENVANLICYKTNLRSNYVGINSSGESTCKIVECKILTGGKVGIAFSDNSKLYSFKSSISDNENAAIISTSNSNFERVFLECEINNNKMGFAKENNKADAQFINCNFSSNQVDFLNCADTRNVFSEKKVKELYKEYFSSEIRKICHEKKECKFFQQQLFDKNSIEIIFKCLSQISEKFDSTIFYQENLKKLVSVCKDFCPNNDVEIDFIKALCEEGLLEELARKSMKENFFVRLFNITSLFGNKKDFGMFVIQAEQIFNMPLCELMKKEADDGE